MVAINAMSCLFGMSLRKHIGALAVFLYTNPCFLTKKSMEDAYCSSNDNLAISKLALHIWRNREEPKWEPLQRRVQLGRHFGAPHFYVLSIMFCSVCDLRVVLSVFVFPIYQLRLATYGKWTALVIAMEASMAPTDGEYAPGPVTAPTEAAAPADVPANQPLAAITPEEYILGPDVKILEKSDGTYAISTGGIESAIPKPHFDKLLEAIKANVSSNISSMTGLLVDRTRQLSSSVNRKTKSPSNGVTWTLNKLDSFKITLKP